MHTGLRIRILITLALLAAVTSLGRAQYFGQNKVQYEARDWSIIKTEHFHLYFHEGERRVALDVARMAERAYDRLSTLLEAASRWGADNLLVPLGTSFLLWGLG